MLKSLGLAIYYSLLPALKPPSIYLHLSVFLSSNNCTSYMINSKPIYKYLRLATKVPTPLYTIFIDRSTEVIVLITSIGKVVPSSCSGCISDTSKLYTLSKDSVGAINESDSGGDISFCIVATSIIGLTTTTICSVTVSFILVKYGGLLLKNSSHIYSNSDISTMVGIAVCLFPQVS